MSDPSRIDEIRQLARDVDTDPRYQSRRHPVSVLAGYTLDLCREVETLRERLARRDGLESARHAFRGNQEAVGFRADDLCSLCKLPAQHPTHFRNGGVFCDVDEGHCCCGAAHSEGEPRG